MGKHQNKLTSITEAQSHKFLKEAKLRATLQCNLITGFHLVQLATGGTWRYRYRDQTGKRRVATIGRYGEYKPMMAAQLALGWSHAKADPLEDKQEQRKLAINEQRIAEQRTLRNYLDRDYRRYMETWSSESAKTNYRRIQNHFSEFLDRDMVEINRNDIRAWQNIAEEKGGAYTTMQRNYNALKTLLNHAAENEVIPENPLKKVKLSPPKQSDQLRLTVDHKKSERRMLSSNEIKGVFSGLKLFTRDIRDKRASSIKHGKSYLPNLANVELPHWFIPYCQLALHTGLRPGDLYSLTWEELNVDFGRLRKHPEKTASRALRTGRKPALVEIPLNKTINGVMQTWHKQQGKPIEGLVFPSPRTSRQMDKNAHSRPWKKVKELGGISEDLNFYAFRHHFISTLVKKGLPLLAIAKLVGHKSVDMIQEHYGHLCEVQAADAVDIIAASLYLDTEKRAV